MGLLRTLVDPENMLATANVSFVIQIDDFTTDNIGNKLFCTTVLVVQKSL